MAAAVEDDAFGRAPVELPAELVVEQREPTSDEGNTRITFCIHVVGHHLCWGIHAGHHDFPDRSPDGSSPGASLHTPESWARTIAAAALELAIADSGFPKSPVSVAAKIVVERPAAPAATDTVPILAEVCIVLAHHHICWAIAAD